MTMDLFVNISTTLGHNIRASNEVRDYITITEKAPNRAFSWLKAPTSIFTFNMHFRLALALTLFFVIVKCSRTFV